MTLGGIVLGLLGALVFDGPLFLLLEDGGHRHDRPAARMAAARGLP